MARQNPMGAVEVGGPTPEEGVREAEGDRKGPDHAVALDYRRVERAIRYLEDHRSEQPELQALADHVGLSKHHFHRVFRRWAGTTPKRFLQHLTVERARDLLRDSESVLEAAFAAGLSGGSRLHDHFVTVEGVTPGQVRDGGASLEIRAGIHPSPFGDVLLASTDRGICFLAFLPGPKEGTRRDRELEARRELARRWPEARIVSRLEETAALARKAFAVSTTGDRALPHLHLRGTNFQIQVWRGLLRIPGGSVASYGKLAELVGRSGAARAVARAVSSNPVGYLIPCHRVIRSDGRVGGYRWGEARKRAILTRELGVGAQPPDSSSAGRGAERTDAARRSE